MEDKPSSKRYIFLIIAIALVIGGLVYGGYEFYNLNQDYEDLKSDLQDTEESFSETERKMEAEIAALEKDLAEEEHDNVLLNEALQNERQKNQDLQETVGDISDQLSQYERLNELDPELLKKYSKVYFLSEHYVPSDLSLIENKYLYNEDEPEQIHTEVKPLLIDMIQQAERDGVELYVRSGYRSFNTQLDLKSQYEVIYGEGTANQFSAEQGYSEHQLGTTVDFLTPGINGNLDNFGETEAFEWLQNNAHRFGFILSYPEDNEYYQYEPWHWRFVGRELAKDLKEEDMNFYDMKQREIDEYLINIFE